MDPQPLQPQPPQNLPGQNTDRKKILSNLRPVPVYEGMPTEKEALEKTEHRRYAEAPQSKSFEINLRELEPGKIDSARTTAPSSGSSFHLPQQGKNYSDANDPYREAPVIEKKNNIPSKIEAIPVPPPPQPKPAIARVIPPVDPAGLSRIRTFEGDVADTVKNQKTSAITIAMAEQKKKEGTDGLANKPTQIHSSALLTISALLLVVGAGILMGVYFFVFYKAAPTLPPAVETTITADTQKEIVLQSLTDPNASELLKAEQEEVIKEGSVKRIVVTHSLISPHPLLSAEELFNVLKVRSSPTLVRALDKEVFLGTYGDKNSEPFIILYPKSFEIAFPEMLAWEKTLYEDIQALFLSKTPEVTVTPVALPQGNSTTTASTTQSTTASTTLPQSHFEDVVIKNNNVRVLRNTAGESILLYSFPDNNHLIITTSEAALREIFLRLTTARAVSR